jgi:hypothetical protein
MERANSIEVEGLVREFKKGPRAVDGIDLRVEPARPGSAATTSSRKARRCAP